MTDEAWKDERETTIAAPPDRVWDAWSEPAHLARWFCDDADGEPREGEKLVHLWKEFGFEVEYRVVEARRGETLVLDGSRLGQPFRQTLKLTPEGDGTRLFLAHTGDGAPDQSIAEDCDSGWKLAFTILETYARDYFGQKPQRALELRQTPASIDGIVPYFDTAAGLSRWLSEEAEIAGVGEAVRMDLRGGRDLTGRLLEHSGRELAIGWEEVGGVLELKAFEAGGTRSVGLRLTSWGEVEIGSVRRDLAAAVDRLVKVLEN